MKQKVNGPVAAAVVVVAILAILAVAYMKFVAPPPAASQKDISAQLNGGFAATMAKAKAQGITGTPPPQISGGASAPGTASSSAGK